MSTTTISFNLLTTLIVACFVLLLGYYCLKYIKVLQKYSIPEPVVGGLIIAIIILVLRQADIHIRFDDSLRTPFMLAFFGSIGLSANLNSLKSGGRLLMVFIACIAIFLVIQNSIGIMLAKLFGLDSLVGLMLGSITLSGGHGTAGAWGPIFEQQYQLVAANELGIAGATFGLVLGCLIGGPVGRFLIKRLKNPPQEIIPAGYQETTGADTDRVSLYETIETESRITPLNFIKTLMLLLISMFIGELIMPTFNEYIQNIVRGFSEHTANTKFSLPSFVYVLFVGVILSNLLAVTKLHKIHERSLSTLGNVSLMLFLALALMTLKLWDLVSLALPMVVILTLQTLAMAMFAIFVTFRMLGSNYDAAVIAAGHCGFGLGATPTAIANMQSLTSRFGNSHVAFLIVPMVGAFFIDLLNAVIIQLFLFFI